MSGITVKMIADDHATAAKYTRYRLGHEAVGVLLRRITELEVTIATTAATKAACRCNGTGKLISYTNNGDAYQYDCPDCKAHETSAPLTDDEAMARDGEDMCNPAYWRGHDAAVHGVAQRWREALEDPMPSPGVMNEPLESLYRRTEALRAAVSENAQ